MRKLTSCLLFLTSIMTIAVSAADYDPQGPTPRLADGTPNLGPLEDGLGLWGRGPGPMVAGADYPAA